MISGSIPGFVAGLGSHKIRLGFLGTPGRAFRFILPPQRLSRVALQAHKIRISIVCASGASLPIPASLVWVWALHKSE
jgi:hypothetical protein